MQNIRMVTYNNVGEKVELNVKQFHKSLLRLTGFMPKLGQWSIDVTQHFINHVSPDIRDGMESQGFTYNTTASTKDAFSQITALQNAFAAASLADKNVSKIKLIAQEEMKSSHAFITKVLQSSA